MTDAFIGRLLYTALCLGVIAAIFNLQSYRHKDARGCLWWSYTFLAGGVGWDLIDCWKYDAPGFPASRWVIMPSLAVVMGWAAISDWLKRRPGGNAEDAGNHG